MWQVAAIMATTTGSGLMAWYAYMFRDARDALRWVKLFCIALAFYFNLLTGQALHMLTASTTTTEILVVVGSYVSWIITAAIFVWFAHDMFLWFAGSNKMKLAKRM